MIHTAWCLGILAALSVQAKDNPEYEHWANCKPGSWVKFKIEGEMRGQKFEMTETAKLLEVTQEKCVVEHTRAGKVGPQELPPQVQKEDVKAKDEEPDKVLREGEEEIEVDGKKFKCRVIDLEKAKDKSTMKIWVTKEIPGGVVRGEISPPPGQKGVMKITSVGWEKK